MSGARVTVAIRLTENWPGDDAFDVWLWALEQQIETLELAASAEIVEWERLYDLTEPVE